MACDKKPSTIIPITPAAGDILVLDVLPKYKKLMTASIGEDSLYERSKKTIFELSKDLNMTEAQRMDIVAGQITQMTVGITAGAMAQAISWAETDATIGYNTAKLKAEAVLVATKAETEAFNKCKTENEANLVCANITATIAGSIRENGRVLQYDTADLCKPTALHDEGLKYEQALQVNGSTYQILADAYRKSGIVQVGFENGTRKGVDGDRDGHTFSQTAVANRQVVSFEDSKRNHAVNASSQTIGQMIAAEAPIDDLIVQNYNKGMEYLLQDSVPVIPGGPVSLDGVEVNWDVSGTDNVDTNGNLTSQAVTDQVTTSAVFNVGANTRNGDSVILKINGGEYYGRHIVTTNDLSAGFVLMTFPTVNFNAAGASVMQYTIDSYIQDMAGNTSAFTTYNLDVKYIPYN